MNPRIQKAIKALYKKLGKIIKSWEAPAEQEIPKQTFHSLSPIKDADVTQYITALQWALDNKQKESIYNIALTGPYGSGKSSILKTFQDQNKNKDYVFLEISLATFKEELTANSNEQKDGNDDVIPTKDNQARNKNEDTLRLIELSILQQIFYHEEDSKIPDSRFKKIRSFKRKHLIWITTGVLTALLFGLNLFVPDKIEAILKVKFPTILTLILHWLSLLIFLASISVIVFRSIRLFYGIKISKFKFKEAEIEIDKNISKSILNNHLDEILYFFEVTDYSVVLIEDLDRFRQAEIFTKLRELNLLINNSKKVEQGVVFIYAVRDEMFQDKDRTKFFDFIIPVIPVINSSNSNEKLATIVSDNDYQISNDLIDDVALFIDDMRLLYNITNEYHIYRQLLDEALNQDNLLAMIVYKNIYPDDFVLLSDGMGKLFGLLNSKVKYVNDTVAEINEQIKTLKIELGQIGNIQIKDGDELRMLYLSYYVNKIKGFANFTINGVTKSLKETATDADLFEYIIGNDVSYSYFYLQYNQAYTTQKDTEYKFNDIEKEVDSEQTFSERLELIDSYWEEREEVIKQEIQKLEKQKLTTRHLKLQQILSDKSAKIEIDTTTRQGLLLRLLLRSGYINEDYLDYISLFYEGSITKVDRTFLLNVKSQSALEYDFSLTKIENLVGKIRSMDFQQPYLLNFNLLDFLLVNDGYQTQLDNLLSQLNDQNANGPEFIEGFLASGTNIEVFVRELAATWTGLWKYVAGASVLPKERKEEYFKLIIANAAIDDLKKMAEQSDLLALISNREDFLSIIPDEARIQEIIKSLNVKFEILDFKGSSKKLTAFVYKGNYYKISEAMIIRIIQQFGTFDLPSFDRGNYNAILKSGCPELIAYINAEINLYTADVYLVLPSNTSEPEESLLKLLNNKDIKLGNRIKIIEREETKVTDLAELTEQSTDDILFETSKVEPTWQNLIEYFMRHELSIAPAMVSFLNDIENSEALANEVIDLETPYPDLPTVEALMSALVNETDIEDQYYETLLKAVPYNYGFDEVADVGKEKLKLLIAQGSIESTVENYTKLKEGFPGLHLLFLENTSEYFLAAISDYELDANDIRYLLESLAFSASEKNTIIITVDEDIIIASGQVLKIIAKLIFENFPYSIPRSILIAILQQSLSLNDRVKLFNMHFKQFVIADISAIFKTFPYPYSDIGVVFTSPVIDYGKENEFLANNLKQKGFIANSKNEKKGIRLINYKKDK